MIIKFVKILKKIKINNTLFLLLFFIFSCLILNDIIFQKGLLLGGDWSFPFNRLEIKKYFSIFTNTWYGINWGSRNIGLSSFYFAFIFYLFSIFSLNGAIISKIILLVLFTFSGYSFFSLLKYLKFKNISAFIGGLIYITTPIFFNYTIMGWAYVILFMALLPLGIKYFLKANLENKISCSIIVSIIYSLSLIQSQALFWFAIIFFILGFYLIKNKKTLLIYIKNLSIIFIFTILLSFFWLGGILLIKDNAIIGSDVVKSAVSLGSMGHFYPVNILRLFGGLYNFQYEFIINNSKFLLFSFLIPLLAILSLFIKRVDKKIITIFFVIGFVPIGMYILNSYRDLLLYIPFSNIIRDFARFTVISTFSFSVLASFFLNYLLLDKKIYKKIIFSFFIVLWIFSIFPWWNVGIGDWKEGLGPNQRLRLKNIDKEYNNLNYFFNNKKLDNKALFLPIYGTVSFEDDNKFNGTYQEIQDIFSFFSLINGEIIIADKSAGQGDLFNKNIIKDILFNDFNKINNFSILNQYYYIIRKNMVFENKSKILNDLSDNKELIKIIDNNKIAVYKKNGKDFLPHFYTPQTIIKTSQNISTLPDIVSEEDYNIRSATYFSDNTYSADDKTVFDINAISKTEVKNTPIIEFKKVNPTKYKVIIHGAKSEFPLIFSESFHEGWKSYLATSKSNFKTENLKFKNEDYKILDGNEDDQASLEELKDYIDKGYISNLGDLKSKNIKHVKWENNKEVFDYNESYKIDFISKNFNGTIQNDNLDNGKFYETWLREPIDNNKNHSIVNGYANSWNIDPNSICNNNSKCIKNTDGSYDMEFTIEFWPQRLFYIGLFISGTTLIGCVTYLIIDGVKNRKKSSFAEATDDKEN